MGYTIEVVILSSVEMGWNESGSGIRVFYVLLFLRTCTMKNYGVTDPWAKIPGSKLRAKCFVLAHGLRADSILKGWHGGGTS